MKRLAVLGTVSLMLISVILGVLPVCLAAAVSPAWLGLYAVYLLLAGIYAALVIASRADDELEQKKID